MIKVQQFHISPYRRTLGLSQCIEKSRAALGVGPFKVAHGRSLAKPHISLALFHPRNPDIRYISRYIPGSASAGTCKGLFLDRGNSNQKYGWGTLEIMVLINEVLCNDLNVINQKRQMCGKKNINTTPNKRMCHPISKFVKKYLIQQEPNFYRESAVALLPVILDGMTYLDSLRALQPPLAPLLHSPPPPLLPPRPPPPLQHLNLDPLCTGVSIDSPGGRWQHILFRLVFLLRVR